MAQRNHRPDNRVSSLSLFFLLVVFALLFSPPLLRAQNWADKAKAEGTVVVYHTTNVPDMTKIIKGFRKRYPFLKVEGFRGTGEKLIQKITTEVRAGRHLADVYQISGLQTWLLQKMGYLAPYQSPGREKVNPLFKDRQGYWTGVYWNLEVLGYNTGLVSSGEVPRKWEDLLNPRWTGKIGLEDEDVNWYAYLLELMGEEKGKDFMRRLAKQKIHIRAGHTLLTQLLAAGEFELVPTVRTHGAEKLISAGAPIDWVAIEPLAPNPPICVSLPKNPPHPNAAKLFVDFILSREGQGYVSQLMRNPSRADVKQPVPRVAKVRLLAMDHGKVAENYNRYASEYRKFFGIR
jgi:iron(III) transport system substrate-binding protein